MRIPTIFSTTAAVACLGLCLWLYIGTSGNGRLQATLQQREATLQEEQEKFSGQQQQLQTQQQQINTANNFQQQVMPTVISELRAVALQNKNEKLKSLLARYKVPMEDAAPAAATGTKPAK